MHRNKVKLSVRCKGYLCPVIGNVRLLRLLVRIAGQVHLSESEFF